MTELRKGPNTMDNVDPVQAQLEALRTQVADYRAEVQAWRSKRRTANAGVWFAVVFAWLMSAAVVITTVVSLADTKHTGVIGWVAFVGFLASAVATGLGSISHSYRD